jgi:hypothetical protein
MTLALRRTVFLDGERRADDYEVRYAGRTVGRILRLRSTGRELWHWTQIDVRAPSYGPNGGVADTFEEAKAAFRRTWDEWGLFKTVHGRSPRSNEELQQWVATRGLAARARVVRSRGKRTTYAHHEHFST